MKTRRVRTFKQDNAQGANTSGKSASDFTTVDNYVKIYLERKEAHSVKNKEEKAQKVKDAKEMARLADAENE